LKFLIDTHCHTVASGHAYSTVQEIAKEANNKGLEIIAITDHGPDMPGGPHMYHFGNLRVVPNSIFGVEILKGIEANIMDTSGTLDLPEFILKKLDLVLASLHEGCFEPGDVDHNTKALIKAMENPYVDIIAHPGNPLYPIDEEAFVLKAKETNTLIEINNSSFVGSRRGSRENCIKIAKLCKKHGVMVAAGSDCHISFDVGRFDKVIEIFSEIDMPDELIINLHPSRFKQYLKSKGKIRFMETTITPEI
jgi:putative hydrolase